VGKRWTGRTERRIGRRRMSRGVPEEGGRGRGRGGMEEGRAAFGSVDSSPFLIVMEEEEGLKVEGRRGRQVEERRGRQDMHMTVRKKLPGVYRPPASLLPDASTLIPKGALTLQPIRKKLPDFNCPVFLRCS
jgi:hypothetical protein